MATIQGIYIALFGRPADPLGLDYFEAETNGGADLTAIGDLAATAEYQARFEGMSNVQIINSIYQSLFGRDADLAGLTFFSTALQNGTYDINNIAIAILDGAQGDDLATVNNKIEAANLFTASLDTGSEVVAYQGEAAADAGRAFLSGITEDEATVPTQTEVDAAINGIVDQEPVGNTFNFSDAIGEQIVGTAQADTINGVVGTGGTFNVGDSVNGGGSTDTLNLLVTDATSLPAGTTVSGVEVVNLNLAGAGTLVGLNSSSFSGAQQIWQIDNDAVAAGTFGAITVGAGVTAGFRSTGAAATDVAVAATVTAAAGATSLSVALDGVADNSVVTLAETTANGVSTVSVSGSVVTDTGSNDLDLSAAGLGDVDTLDLDLTSNTTVDVSDFTDLATLDASGSTGNLTVAIPAGAVELTTANFGSGNETVTFATAAGTTADAIAINLGAGNDVLNFDGANVTEDATVSITLGAGNDTLAIDALANVSDDADVANDLVTVTDFNADQDVLDLSGLNGVRETLDNTQIANISGAASLDAALDLVAQYVDTDTLGAEDFAIFNYGGDAYVYVSNTLATTTFTDGDGLIKLTGVNVDNFDSSSLIV